MIIETQGGYSFVILGPGDEIEVLDEDIWYEGERSPLRIGSYGNREEAQSVMREIERSYAQECPSYKMPPRSGRPETLAEYMDRRGVT